MKKAVLAGVLLMVTSVSFAQHWGPGWFKDNPIGMEQKPTLSLVDLKATSDKFVFEYSYVVKAPTTVFNSSAGAVLAGGSHTQNVSQECAITKISNYGDGGVTVELDKECVNSITQKISELKAVYIKQNGNKFKMDIKNVSYTYSIAVQK